jgi:transcriptional regulator with XRE-family HTH domain
MCAAKFPNLSGMLLKMRATRPDSPPDAGALGRVIRQYREAARLTQEELGTASGVGSKTVSRIERGNVTDPGFTDVVRLGRALGLSPNVLSQHMGINTTGDEFGSQDPRWEWIRSWLGRADKAQREQWLQMAFATAVGLEHVKTSGLTPSRDDLASPPRRHSRSGRQTTAEAPE